MKKWLPILLAVLVFAACTATEEADLVVHNATIYTMDELNTKTEAMAIRDGKIVEVGPENQILNKYRAKEKKDAAKAVIYPGFIDAHCHFLGYGLYQSRVNLVGTESFDEVLERTVEFFENDDSPWLLGRGWDQNDWQEKTYPANDSLNALFPDRYVVLKRVDGHAMLVNDLVLEKAGITSETTVPGGEIKMDEDGPTGILIDEAMTLVEDIIPEPGGEAKVSALLTAQEDCFGVGLTTVDDAGLSVESIELIRSLQAKKQLKMRVYAMYSADPELMKNLPAYTIQTDRLTAKSVKVYADGALGSRGAHLHQPYSDDSTTNGLSITPYDSLLQWAKACYDAGFQMNVHCIGDRANHEVLSAMSEVLGGTNDRRWRIEHAQVLRPEDFSLFGQFNIIPSVQPTHATSDMYWAEDRLGDTRIQSAYAYQTLLRENGLLPLGTDFPVEGISPIQTFYAAVTRRDKEGYPESGFLSNQALSRMEALKGMTIWAAIANFEEELKGSLVPGKVADFVILNKDLVTCSDAQILDTEVLETWIDGEQVYAK